jgi:hypothetical protein
MPRLNIIPNIHDRFDVYKSFTICLPSKPYASNMTYQIRASLAHSNGPRKAATPSHFDTALISDGTDEGPLDSMCRLNPIFTFSRLLRISRGSSVSHLRSPKAIWSLPTPIGLHTLVSAGQQPRPSYWHVSSHAFNPPQSPELRSDQHR